MMQSAPMAEPEPYLVPGRRGHFLLESGYHGELWLSLERLCLRPERVRELADRLAESLDSLHVEFICGPLVEGAFVGLLIALRLNARFAYSEPFARASTNGLFPVGYRVPEALRGDLRGRRVAIVNDVISAGSAVRGTLDDLQACGAHVVAIGSLLVLGEDIVEFAASKAVPLLALARVPNPIWPSSECPLCAAGVPMEDPGNFAGKANSRSQVAL